MAGATRQMSARKKRPRAPARGAPLTIQLPRATFEIQAAQQWGLRARDLVEAHDISVAEAYPVSEKWGFTSSQYLWMERDIEPKGMGVSAHLTRFIAACHVLRHYKAMRAAYAENATAEFWMRSYYVARHAGTMMRADMLLAERSRTSKRGLPGADKAHKRDRENREKAIRAYQEGDCRNVAEVARQLKPLLHHSERTIRNWLHAFNREQKAPRR